MNEITKEKLNNLIKNNEVCLFMKGTPEVPQCGFSLAVSNVLKHLEVKFKGINVLENTELREGIKESSVCDSLKSFVFALIISSDHVNS